MNPGLGKPVEFGLNTRYLEFEYLMPLALVCAFSLLLSVLWLIVVMRYLRTGVNMLDKT